jgi:uncharacterized membrane protein required for colicin V production
MNWLDIVIIIVWIVTALWGFRVGFLQMSISLILLVGGLALSSRIAEPVGDLFSPITDSEQVQTIAAFITIFILLFIISAVVAFILRAMLRFLPLFGLADRLAGMAVGVLIGFVLLSGVLTAIQRYPVTGIEDHIDRSPLATFVADNFDVVIRGAKLIPGDWDNKFRQLQGK